MILDGGLLLENRPLMCAAAPLTQGSKDATLGAPTENAQDPNLMHASTAIECVTQDIIKQLQREERRKECFKGRN